MQGKTRRKAIEKLIIPKLSNVLSEKQKKAKFTNFLSALRMDGKIRSAGWGIWELKSQENLKEFKENFKRV
jgi:ATP-dependent DNA helicase RecG